MVELGMYPAQVESKTDRKSVTVIITEGMLKGKSFTIPIDETNQVRQIPVNEGDKVIVSVTEDAHNKEIVYITDYQRSDVLLVLTILFLIIVIAVSRLKGIRSLLAMVFSFIILSQFILPQIIAGNNPVLISLLGALLILPVSFYFAHGISKKTTVALVGTFLSLIITGLLSYVFVVTGKITGFANEEAVFLQAQGASIDIQSALLAGIIIGAMGILDDVTISQAAVVEKLKSVNTQMGLGNLYRNAMDIGRDHIASLVNTLILVYAGASLPLFLLFYTSKLSYTLVLNQELIATEIIRTLVSSIGIILAVPVTTVIAAYYYTRR